MTIKLRGYIEIIIFLMAFIPMLILIWQYNFAEKENVKLLLISMSIATIPFFINFFHMLINAFKRSSLLWTLIIFFVPFGNFVYYLFIYIPKSEKYGFPQEKLTEKITELDES